MIASIDRRPHTVAVGLAFVITWLANILFGAAIGGIVAFLAVLWLRSVWKEKRVGFRVRKQPAQAVAPRLANESALPAAPAGDSRTQAAAAYRQAAAIGGIGVLTDERRLRSTFLDLSGGTLQRELAALVAATTAGIGAKLLDSATSSAERSPARLTKTLTDSHAIDAALAAWAVTTMAGALVAIPAAR